MTNEELLKETSDKLLTNLDKQRRFCLQQNVVRKPCQSCRTLQNAYEASGRAINDDDFGVTKRSYTCINQDCKKELTWCLPMFGPAIWYWEVK